MFNLILLYLLFSVRFLFRLVTAEDIHLFNTAINLSQAVYCNNTNNWKCETCTKDNKNLYIYDENSMKFIAGYNKYYNSTYIAIRGTENIMNWMDDIRCTFSYPYSDYPYVAVETGLYILYSKIKSNILEQIISISNKYNTNTLILTGHSMGSIVTFIPFDLYFDNIEFKNIKIVTFGSPRIGNNEFVNMFNSFDNVKSYRITHYYDIVPHVPESILGYKHIPQEIWYDLNNYKYTYCNDSNNEDPNCSNSCGHLHCNSIDNHLYYLNITMGQSGDC